MKSVSFPFRKAVIDRIGIITYRGVIVPIWDTYANGPTANINIGNNIPVKAWIRLLNQTADDDSPKCMRQDMATIQIQVQVSFNANSGNYEHSELIMDLVLEELFDGNSGAVIMSTPFYLSCLNKISERNIDFQDNSNRVYMKSVTIQGRVSQS